MSHKENKNPYATADGGPISGKEPQFFSWAKARQLEINKKLSGKERKQKEIAERKLARRMNP